MYEFNVLEF